MFASFAFELHGDLSVEERVGDSQAGEFILMYEHVRRASSPTATLMDFLQTTYEAAAALADWDRESLEKTSLEPAAGAA